MKSKGGIVIGVVIGGLIAAGALFYFFVLNKPEAPVVTSPVGEQEETAEPKPTATPTVSGGNSIKIPSVAPKKPSPVQESSDSSGDVVEEEEVIE